MSCDEVLVYAMDNRVEWAEKGKSIIEEWLAEEESEPGLKAETSTDVETDDGTSSERLSSLAEESNHSQNV